MPDEEKKPFWARCADCAHTWAVAYFPMEARLFAKLAMRHAACPKCGGKGQVPRQDNGVLLEEGTDAQAG